MSQLSNVLNQAVSGIGLDTNKLVGALMGSGGANPIKWNVGFQRNYMWDVLLPDLGGGLGLSILGIQLPKGFSAPVGILVSRYCQEVKFGQYGVTELVEMKKGGKLEKFAGLRNIDKITLTFLKPVPDVVSYYFYRWRQLVCNDKGYYGVKSAYAKTMRMILYDVTGISTAWFKAVNTFPLSAPVYSMDYTNEKLLTLSMEFSVDDVEGW